MTSAIQAIATRHSLAHTPDAADEAKTWKAATDFEAMTINQLVEPMFSTIDTAKDMFSGGTGEEQLKPMLVNEMAKEMQKAGGLGLAQPIYNQMLKMQEDAK